MTITRREFCKASGTLVVSAVFSAVPVSAAGQPAHLSPSLGKNPFLSTWLRMSKDGSIDVFSGKCEFGQGIGTALSQIVADELDVSLARVRFARIDTDKSPDEGYSFGSLSVEHSGSALRQAAAEMRHILILNAARQLATRPERLSVRQGEFLVDGAPSSVSYVSALTGADFDVEVTGEVLPKSAASYDYVGRPVARIDLPGKVFAEPSFIQDVRVPGMLHARVVRAASQGQTLAAVDESVASSMPGVVSVVRDGSFLAVVAAREEQAIAAAETLRRSADWVSKAGHVAAGSPLALRQSKTEDSVVHRSNSDTAKAVRELVADYSRPFTAHASMSPSAALARWEGEGLTVWSHGQGMYPLRGAIAKVVGLPEDRVQLLHREASGCYGHNGADDAACDAAIIAKHLPGETIRLQWSRQDEFRYEPVGSAMSVRMAAGLDEGGKLTHWRYDVWSGTHSSRPGGAAGAGYLHAAGEISNPIDRPAPRNLQQPAGGGDRNALPLYAFPNQVISKHLVLDSPRVLSALRTLGAFGNVFAIESFIDELALATGADPLDLRLEYMKDERARIVLESMRDVLLACPERRDGFLAGRGLGFAQYKNRGAYAAVVCEVQVNQSTGEIEVTKAFAAVDAGLVVNPDGFSNQIEGGVVQSTSWVLKESVRVGSRSRTFDDWSDYRILRFGEVPSVEVNIINSQQRSVGAGEAVHGPTAGAIGNAVAAACGIRLRDLPLIPKRVLAALGDRPAQSR